MNKSEAVEGIMLAMRTNQAKKKEADRKPTKGINVVAYYKQEKEHNSYRKFRR